MKRRILVIENNSTLLHAYHLWLCKLGYEVQFANTMRMAEMHLESQRYHGVVYDIDIAGSRGVDFLREYWLQFRIDGTSVAVISHSGRFQYECESMGICFYSKPSRLQELEQIVVSLIGDIRRVSTRPLPQLQF